MSDTPQNDLAFMLGRIQGDVKHILDALTRNQEQFNQINTQMSALERRLDGVEKFNVRVLTWASIGGSALIIGVNVGLKLLGL